VLLIALWQALRGQAVDQVALERQVEDQTRIALTNAAAIRSPYSGAAPQRADPGAAVDQRGVLQVLRHPAQVFETSPKDLDNTRA
jgi:hypothetical protein